MATYQIAAGLDDAYSASDSPFFANDTDFVAVIHASVYRQVYLRWDVDISQGDTVISATIELKTAYDNYTGTEDLTISGFDEDNVGNFPDRVTAQGYDITTANQTWTLTNWTENSWYESPSLVAVIQEIVDRPGFTGGYLGLRIDADEFGTQRLAFSYEESGNVSGAKLHLEYTTPAAGWSAGKTFNGVAVSTIKAINGVAIANIKKVNGV